MQMAKICSARMTCSCTEPGEWPARQPVRVRSCGSAQPHEPRLRCANVVRVQSVCVQSKFTMFFARICVQHASQQMDGCSRKRRPTQTGPTLGYVGLAPVRAAAVARGGATRHAPERRLVRFSRCVRRRVPRKNARATQATDTHGSAACQGAQISSLALLNFSSSWQVPHDCGQRESIEAGFFSHSPLCAQSGHATSLSAHTVCQSNRQRGMSERSAAHAHARARKGNSGRQGAGGLRRSPRRRRRSWGSRASRRPGC